MVSVKHSDYEAVILMGKALIGATHATLTLIKEQGVTRMLMVGIAGSLGEENRQHKFIGPNIGDVVIATATVVDNGTTPAYPQINIVGARNNFGAGGEDAVTEKGGRVFAPPAAEAFAYDLDGNLTSDGRWVYTWDAENRLISMEAVANVPTESKLKLEFAYDYMGRRVQKRVYAWSIPMSSYQLQSATSFVYSDGI